MKYFIYPGRPIVNYPQTKYDSVQDTAGATRLGYKFLGEKIQYFWNFTPPKKTFYISVSRSTTFLEYFINFRSGEIIKIDQKKDFLFKENHVFAILPNVKHEHCEIQFWRELNCWLNLLLTLKKWNRYISRNLSSKYLCTPLPNVQPCITSNNR